MICGSEIVSCRQTAACGCRSGTCRAGMRSCRRSWRSPSAAPPPALASLSFQGRAACPQMSAAFFTSTHCLMDSELKLCGMCMAHRQPVVHFNLHIPLTGCKWHLMMNVLGCTGIAAQETGRACIASQAQPCQAADRAQPGACLLCALRVPHPRDGCRRDHEARVKAPVSKSHSILEPIEL